MNTNFSNMLAGIAQAVVPAAVAYLVGKGWLSQSAAAEVGAAFLTLLAAGWSGVTTKLNK
jgi:hypothetical protein